jgi:hypothetical protein
VRVRWTIALLLLALPALASAGGGELTASTGVRFGGSVDADSARSSTLDPALVYGLTYDIKLAPEKWIAVLWSRQKAEVDLPGLVPEHDSFDLTSDYLQVGGVYRPERDRKSNPFVMFSLGVTRVDSDLPGFDSDIVLSGMIGGGTKIAFGERLGLRLDARGYFTLEKAELNGVCGGVGCTVRFAADGAFQFEGLVGVTYAF